MNKLLILLAISLISYHVVITDAANILAVLPSIGISHFYVGSALMKGLVKSGHTVTVVSPFPLKEPLKNYKDIDLSDMVAKALAEFPNFFNFRDVPAAVVLHMVYTTMGPDGCKNFLKHPNVVSLLKTDEKFDLVVVEVFANEALYGFGQHFNAPVIALSSFGASKWTNDLVGTPAPVSYIPHTFLSFTDKMSFWQRFYNGAFSLVEDFYYAQVYLPKMNQIYDEAFPNAKITFDEARKNISLALLNNHFSLSFPKPYAPNMIEVGGMHVVKAKPLPESLESHLNSAEHGVIYFSMGSGLQAKHFPEAKRNAFIKVFASLKQKVLWKYENETIPNKPDNLMIQKWMPQNDILGHPNVKLFITHGGLLGSTESLYHGKPMVGIPIFGDQFLNVARGEQAGYAVKLDYDEISEQTVAEAINKVLNNPSYSNNAQKISKLYKDQPLTPIETAVYWTEYVIRHKGAAHMKSSSLELSFIQYNMIDVLAVMLIIMLVVVLAQIMIVKKIIGLIFKPKAKVDKKKRN